MAKVHANIAEPGFETLQDPLERVHRIIVARESSEPVQGAQEDSQWSKALGRSQGRRKGLEQHAPTNTNVFLVFSVLGTP